MNRVLLQIVIQVIQLYCILNHFPHPVHAVLIPPANCEIHNVEGFLQNVCVMAANEANKDQPEQILFKCISTDQYYHVGTYFQIHSRSLVATVDVLCEDDPHFYQACATRVVPLSPFYDFHHLNSADLPCGYLCHKKRNNNLNLILSIPSTGVRVDHNASSGIFCKENNCLNTALDNLFCAERNIEPCDLECDLTVNSPYKCED